MIKVKYIGIDDWNRPVFKQIGANLYYGSTEKLFGYKASEQSVLKRICSIDLTYFGNYFNCEPTGSQPDEDIKIVKGNDKMKIKELIGTYFPIDTYEYKMEVEVENNRLHYRSGSLKGIRYMGWQRATKSQVLDMIDLYPIKSR